MVEYDWESGLKFGRLMLTGKSYFDSVKRRRYVEAICDCDNVIKWIRWDSIQRGFSTSCGCLTKERLRRDKPASTHGLSDDPIYVVYKRMMERCYDPKSKRAKSYKEKGVVVCEQWKDNFPCFYEWAKDKWQKGLQLDKDILYRKKHGTKTGMIYSPEYCCFVTGKENNRTKSVTRYITYKGKTKTMIEWSELMGVDKGVLNGRLNRYGWSIEKALTTPLTVYKKRLSNQPVIKVDS